MKNRKKIILILLILGLFFIALTTVNAEDNSTATLNQPNINNVKIYEDDSSTDMMNQIRIAQILLKMIIIQKIQFLKSNPKIKLETIYLSVQDILLLNLQ